MSTENQKPQNVLEALELKKDSVAYILKKSWEQTKRHDNVGPTEHFTKFHLNLMMTIQTDKSTAFNITLGLLADHVLPLFTEEEKEALRNMSINLEK